MLPKNRRIGRNEISSVLKKGNRFTSPHLLMYVSTSDTKSKFSFSVSKKIAPSAVGRNLYRRRGYSIISKRIKNIHEGYSCFFVFKKGIYPVSYAALEVEVENLLRSSGVLS